MVQVILFWRRARALQVGLKEGSILEDPRTLSTTITDEQGHQAGGK